MSLLIQVTIYNEESGEVSAQFVKTYESNYGYEVERIFDDLGDKFSVIVDPHHEV